MTDPLNCLRNSTIGIGIWNVIYSLIQMGIMGWQCKVVKDYQWEFENRQLPATGFADGFQARFPGLYAIYTETPERRRINAMYVIVLINIFLAFVHFFMSIVLIYGAYKYNKNCIWPWIFSAGPIIIMSTAYAVLWWSGDVFNEQLTMSVAEFVMSLAVNGICLIVVLFFYWRLAGMLTSDKPAGYHKKHKHRPRRRDQPYILQPVGASPYPYPYEIPVAVTPAGQVLKGPLMVEVPDVHHPSRAELHQPPWRTEWPEIPDPQLQKKLKRHRRSRRDPKVMGVRRKDDQGSLDFYAPEAYDTEFPWKLKKMKKQELDERYKPTHADNIEKLYYNNYPEEVPNIPHGMRNSLRHDRKRGQTPNREKIPYFDEGKEPVSRNSVV